MPYEPCCREPEIASEAVVDEVTVSETIEQAPFASPRDAIDLSRDAIKNLPDVENSESAQRLPAVSIEGLTPDWKSIGFAANSSRPAKRTRPNIDFE